MNKLEKDKYLSGDRKKSMESKMEKGDMRFLQLIDNGIYVIDYSGKISFGRGLSNMDIIEKEIRNLSIKKDCLKILFDVRNTIWENRQTHDSLSKISRKIFNPDNFDFAIYIAVLNNEIDGLAFENEHWFFQKKDAIKWLAEKK